MEKSSILATYFEEIFVLGSRSNFTISLNGEKMMTSFEKNWKERNSQIL